MSLRVNQNVLAIQTHSTLSKTSGRLEKSLEKLSSGLRINRAADDAAGLAISEKLRRQIRGLSRAILNAQDGISMVQTAEGALDESHSILQRMRELAIQSGNDTLTSNDRLEIQKEVNTLKDDLDRISRNTEFNTKKLLDGTQTALISSSSQSGSGVLTGVPDAQGEYKVQVTEIQAGEAQQLRSNIMTIKDTSTVASTNTKLESIANFYDANGNFILANAQTIYLQGNSNSAEIVVTKDLTLDQLATKLQDAITNGLGMENSRVNVNLGFSENPGTIDIISGRPGVHGELVISTDQAMSNGLGFSTLVKATDSVHQVRLTDLSGANPMTTQTSTGRASGLLAGIDITFDAVTAGAGIGKQAEKGVVVATNVSFTAVDYLGNSVVVTIGDGAGGSYSLQQLVDLINTQLDNAATPVRMQATVVGGGIQMTSSDTGSGAYIDINDTNAAAQVLGLANGRYTGASGTTAQAVGYSAADLDYTLNNTSFIVFDAHGNGVSVVLTQDYGTLDQLVASINDQIIVANGAAGATPPMVRAYNSSGVILFRSLESGQTSNFQLVDQSNLANKLHVYATTTSNGTGGTSAATLFTPDDQAVIFGYDISAGSGTVSLNFQITDHQGRTTSIVGGGLGAGELIATVTIGRQFVDAVDLVSIINDQIEADGPTAVRATAQLTSDRRLTIRSQFSGEGTFVAIKDDDGFASVGISHNFGLESSTYHGRGAGEFRMHVVNNKPQFQIGADQGQIMQVSMLDMSAAALGVDNLDMTNTTGANRAIGAINIAIDKVSAERSKLGAFQNRLEHAISNLRSTHGNLTSAEARLRDADMAQEMIEFTRNQIISQSGTAMLAQANLVPQGVLQLLR